MMLFFRLLSWFYIQVVGFVSSTTNNRTTFTQLHKCPTLVRVAHTTSDSWHESCVPMFSEKQAQRARG